eukprot:g4818.t1
MTRSEREALRTSTAGARWNNMAAPTMTPELRRELKILRLRQYANPKRFYKALDHGGKAPRYFQLGTVLDSEYQGRNSRVTKRDKKSSLIEELKGDQDFRKYAKRTYATIQEERSAGKRGGSSRKKKSRF